MFCTDTDLLRWEPRLAIDAALASQTRFEGHGRLSGRTLAIGREATGAAGAIAVLGEACFPVSQVAEDTITLAAPMPGTGAALPGEGETDVAIRTFAAQREIVSTILARLARPEEDVGSFSEGQGVVDVTAFRRPATLGTLHLIYAALSAAALGEHADWAVHADLYGRLYRKSLRAMRVQIDTDGDGRFDVCRLLDATPRAGRAIARYDASAIAS